MKLIFQFIFFLVLLIGGIYLCTDNALEVDIVFFGKEFEAKPLWMVMLVSFGAGALVSLIFCVLEIMKAWQKIFVLKRQVKSIPKEEPSASFNEGIPKIEEKSSGSTTETNKAEGNVTPSQVN